MMMSPFKESKKLLDEGTQAETSRLSGAGPSVPDRRRDQYGKPAVRCGIGVESELSCQHDNRGS
jgi:hypothetical protein